MRRDRFAEEQIIGVLREHEAVLRLSRKQFGGGAWNKDSAELSTLVFADSQFGGSLVKVGNGETGNGTWPQGKQTECPHKRIGLSCNICEQCAALIAIQIEGLLPIGIPDRLQCLLPCGFRSGAPGASILFSAARNIAMSRLIDDGARGPVTRSPFSRRLTNPGFSASLCRHSFR